MKRNVTNENYVETAEKVINELLNLKAKNGKPIKILTTSKIRNLLAMTADIYNEVNTQNGDNLNDDTKARIDYLKVRFIYEAGREPSVKNFIECSDIISVIDNIKGSKKGFILFNRYLEALVAYRKYNGGKDE